MRTASVLAIAGLVALWSGGLARAGNLIVNGDFEAGGGSFAGWTTLDQAGGNGHWYIQSGTTTPQSKQVITTPPSGTHAAMTDMNSPGSHMLYQDFMVPSKVTSATLTFDRLRHNTGASWDNGNALDYTIKPNQQARVDIITTTANPFSILPADVLLNVFQTSAADPLKDAAYVTQSVNLAGFLAAHAGQKLRLRFAETDNQGIFQFAVDNVILNVAGSGGSPGEGSFKGVDPPNKPANEGKFGSGGIDPTGPLTAGLPVLVGPFVDPAATIPAASTLAAEPPPGTYLTVVNAACTAQIQGQADHAYLTTQAAIGLAFLAALTLVGSAVVAVRLLPVAR